MINSGGINTDVKVLDKAKCSSPNMNMEVVGEIFCCSCGNIGNLPLEIDGFLLLEDCSLAEITPHQSTNGSIASHA